MFGHCLRLVIGVLGFSACVNAADFGNGDYEVYLGDINNDGASDIYVHGKGQFVLLHGDIVTPIWVPAPTSYEFLTSIFSQGQLTGFNELEITNTTSLLPPEVVEPQYSDQELTDMGLVSLQEGVNYFLGDFDGNGTTDILVTIQGEELVEIEDSGETYFGRMVMISGGSSIESAPTVTQSNIEGRLANEDNIFLSEFIVADRNDDGVDELVRPGGAFNADITYTFSSVGSSVQYEYEIFDEPLSMVEATLNGASTGSFRVSESGAATYSIPLSLPAGTAGVTPDLSLSYSSQAGSGLLGWGWQLNGVSSIGRCRKTLFQDGSTEPLLWDGATFCYNGQRLIKVSEGVGETLYRTIIDTNEIIKSHGDESSPDYFTVLGRDGSLSTYGGTANSQQVGGNDSTLTWSISQFEDSVKNKITYTYDQNDGSDFRLTVVSYAFGAGEYPYSEVEFNYGGRPDVSGGYVAGKELVTTQRLNSITVKNHEPSDPAITEKEEIRRYDMHYLRGRSEDLYDRSYVRAVQECVNNSCLPPTLFEWSKDSSLEFGEPVITDEITYGDNKLIEALPIDINGDGHLDMVWVEDGENHGDHFYKVKHMIFNPVTETFDRKDFIGSTGSCPQTGNDGVDEHPRRILLCENPRSGNEKRVFFQSIDYNGDGRQDLAMYRNDKSAWYIHLSKLIESTGEWRLSGSPEIIFDPGLSQTAIMDVDSDGMPDIVTTEKIFYLRKKANAVPSDSSSYTYFQEEDETLEGVEVENFQFVWDTPRLHNPSDDDLSVESNRYEYDFAGSGDFNGDGSADVILVDRQIGYQWGSSTIIGVADHYYIALREGDLYRIVERVSTGVGARYTDGDRNAPMLAHTVADVNGDSYSDIFREKVAADNNYDYVLRLNTGDGFAASVEIPDFAHSEAERDNRIISLQDMNGDGYLDALSTVKGVSTVRYRPWNNSTQSFDDTPEDLWGDQLSGSDARTMFYDANGDGRLDLVFFSNDRFGISMNLAQGPQGVMTGITNGLGATTSLEYEPMHNSTHYRGVQYAATTSQVTGAVDVDKFYSLINDPFADLEDGERFGQFVAPVLEYLTPVLIVTAVEGNAPSGNEIIGEGGQVNTNHQSRLEYYYYLSRFQAGGLGFLGFKALMTEEPQTEVQTTSFYRQDWPFTGSPDRTERRSPSGDIMGLSQSYWSLIGWDDSWPTLLGASDTGVSALPSIKPYLKHIDETSYKFNTSELDPTQIEAWEDEPGGGNACLTGIKCLVSLSDDAVLQTSSITSEYDNFGNATKVTTITSGGELSQTVIVDNTFPTDQSITLHGESLNYAQLGRVTFTQSLSTRTGGTAVTRESSFTYYGTEDLLEDGSNHHAEGMLKSETIEPNNEDLKRTTTYQYDVRGNKIRADITGRNHQYTFGGAISTQLDQTRSTTFAMDSDVYRYVDTTMTILNGTAYTKEIVTERNEFGSPVRIESSVSDLVTTIEYDVLGRELRRSDNADTVNNDGTGAWARTEYLTCSSVGGCPAGTSYVVRKFAAGGAESLSYYDVLGRVTRAATRSFDAGYAYVDTEYNSKGQVLRISEPYFLGGNKYWKHSSLDILGRPVQITLPDGATQSMSYSGYSTTTTNALGVTRTETKNGFGELISVDEALGAKIEYVYDGAGNLEFVHSMAAPGDPHQQTIVTQLSYDALGRKIAMADPDKGTWEYKYNAFGDLVWQKDAKGQVVMQSYDTSGRLATRLDYRQDGTIEGNTAWYFDGYTEESPTEQVVDNALMQVSAIVMRDSSGAACNASAAIQCVYPSYDRFGRNVATEVRNGKSGVNGNQLSSYITETSFDQIGRVATQTDALNAVVVSNRSGDARYLDNSIQSGIENHYNDATGYLESVSDLQTNKTIYQVLTTNARGQVLTSLRGNNVTSENTYDPLTGQLTKQVGNVSDIFKIQHIEYDWDQIGNLSSRFNNTMRVNGNGHRNKSESFCYDALNRLINTNADTQSTSACENLELEDQDLRYDSRGNITYKHDVGNYTYNTTLAGPHAVTSTSAGDSYLYDDNGNMTDSFGTLRRKMTYSAYDKVTQIVKGLASSPDHTTNFRYGIDRARYWREDIDQNGVVTTTEYLGGVEKITKSNEPGKIEWKRYLGKTAIIALTTDTNNVLLDGAENYKESYVYNDHLGSLDVITDAAGTVIQSLSFDSWGKRRNEDTWQDIDLTDLSVVAAVKAVTTRGYTGHEMLDEVGIIHMNGRIYDARLARFMQADPIIQAATATQSLNRYAYVWNNPLNSTDPSGFINSNVWQREFRTVVTVVFIAVSTKLCGPCSIVVAGMLAKMNGGSDRDILKAAVTQAISYGMSRGGTSGMSAVYSAAAQGVVGGVVSVINGGKFGHGFASGAASALGNYFGGAVGSIVAAGVVSEQTGGKFESGATRAAANFVIGLAVEGVYGGGGEDGSQGAIEEEEEEEEFGEVEEFPDEVLEDAQKGHSYAITDEQRAMAAAEDRKGFWTSRLEDSKDPLARTALNIVNDEGAMEKITNWRLRNYLKFSKSIYSEHDVGVALMNAHIDAVDFDFKNSIGNFAGSLSYKQVDTYHYEVFKQLQISPRVYGGDWVPGVISNPVYCQGCDARGERIR